MRVLMREEQVNGNYWGRGAFESFPEAGYRHAEGFEGFAFRRGVFETPVKIGRYGLRQSDLDQQLEFPELLLLLGDSYTFGLGVAEEATFAHLLQGTLNPLGIGVVNGGQAGYSAQQEAAFGIWLGDRLEPQVILQCLFLGNDVFDDSRHSWRRIDVRYGYRLSKDRLLKGRLFDYLRTHSYVWLFVDGRWNRLRERKAWRSFHESSGLDPAGAVGSTIESVMKLRDYCDERGIAFGVVLMSRVGGPRRFLGPVMTSLEAASVPVLDLGELDFRARDQFEVDGHWNEAGHRRAARHIGAFLDRIRMNRPGIVGGSIPREDGVMARTTGYSQDDGGAGRSDGL